MDLRGKLFLNNYLEPILENYKNAYVVGFSFRRLSSSSNNRSASYEFLYRWMVEFFFDFYHYIWGLIFGFKKILPDNTLDRNTMLDFLINNDEWLNEPHPNWFIKL